MNTLPLFYKKVVPINQEQHSKLHIEAVDNYSFAKETNSLYIAAVEFPKACQHYPIVFAEDGEGAVFPLALLGLKANQNLYVNDKGEWNASYIPAYARRYPFILATPQTDSDQFTVCIDEGYSGFNTAKEGQPLFDKKGEQTPLLQQAVDFLKEYQSHVKLTELFCKNLAEMGVLEPMQASVKMRSGEEFNIGGFKCINREKLKALDADKLAALVKSEQMELIYAHLSSLHNVEFLMNEINKDAEAA